MSYRFTLRLTGVRCANSQMREWGKDEMRLLGFGVTRKGRAFAMSYRDIGSYAEGDSAPPGVVPQTWFDAELEDDGREVMVHLWLVEEDSGAVAAAAAGIETQFFDFYRAEALRLGAASYPRDCIPFLAFHKATQGSRRELERLTSNFLVNDDEVSSPSPYEVFIHYDSPIVHSYGKDLRLSLSTGGSWYDLYLTFRYERVQVVQE